MNIEDIAGAAGVDFTNVGQQFGLTPEQTRGAMASLLPMVMGGMRKQAAGGDLSQVEDLAGRVERPEAARDTGNQILGQIFGSKDVSRQVAKKASTETPGVSDAVMKMLLPIVAAMVGKALTKRMGGGALGGLIGAAAGSMLGGQSGGAGRGAAPTGGFGGLLNALDQDGDGNPIDDIMGMFGRK
ncbi:DUF937 domain-containing protein [Pacificimonas sp. WHA3]|uniref:DUF937 domain-containing protein n=1 Tax=Pacificimonas pallii TaxID=2827236 RepID=A0ABS6SFU1_9SPHN|nr:DUF937 domain-containing protein [Pacificimonas pallii]MBV7257269.1 DUF937 domain-containing protein [Pacificimonas pallii]